MCILPCSLLNWCFLQTSCMACELQHVFSSCRGETDAWRLLSQALRERSWTQNPRLLGRAWGSFPCWGQSEAETSAPGWWTHLGWWTHQHPVASRGPKQQGNKGACVCELGIWFVAVTLEPFTAQMCTPRDSINEHGFAYTHTRRYIYTYRCTGRGLS